MNHDEQAVETPSIFILVLVVGAIAAVTFFVVASFALVLTWLIGFITPLPFWQILTLNAILLLVVVYLVGSRQIVLSFGAHLMILSISAGASVTAVLAAWLLARIAPLSLEQVLLPVGILMITAIIYLFHAADDLIFELQQTELREEEEALVSRLRNDPPRRKSRKR
jgi:hypothetical protein